MPSACSIDAARRGQSSDAGFLSPDILPLPSSGRSRQRHPDPTPEEISAGCEAIRAGWSAAKFRRATGKDQAGSGLRRLVCHIRVAEEREGGAA